MTSYADNIGMLEDSTSTTQIKFSLGSEDDECEWIKITSDGFWVRGEKVPQDDKEAITVYNAFKEFLSWASITRQY
jgi:hypothetical protein